MFDRRALAVAVLIAGIGIGVGVVLRFSSEGKTWQQPEEFQFSVDQPKPDEVKLRDPTPPVVEEREITPQTPEIQIERPNIQMRTTPEVNPNPQELIKSDNNQIQTPKIQVNASAVDIPDAPTDLDLVTDLVNVAPDVIAVETSAAADYILRKDPRPSTRDTTLFLNTAPRPSAAVAVVPKAFGDPNALSSGVLGPMDISLLGTGTSFINNPPFGSVQTRSAVEAALRWLATHQHADGSWHAQDLEGPANASLAVTGLASLAFLGANYHTRTKHPQYRRVIIRAIDHLLKHQGKNGTFSQDGKASGIEASYTHAICAIAICEAYGRARDEVLQSAAQRALDACATWQNSDGGWRYHPTVGPSDTSVSAWFMQALKAGKMAQLKVDPGIYQRGRAYFDALTHLAAGKDSNGTVSYTLDQTVTVDPKGHPALTCAGMLIRQFDGMSARNPLLVKAADSTRALDRGTGPDWTRKDFYLWYYATYAMHNMGGEHRLWWNRRVRATLLENQVRSGPNAGSWDPAKDRWGDKAAGRVYTTALGALILEVAYRYDGALQTYGKGTDLSAELDALRAIAP